MLGLPPRTQFDGAKLFVRLGFVDVGRGHELSQAHALGERQSFRRSAILARVGAHASSFCCDVIE
jgi:hypothetical protein